MRVRVKRRTKVTLGGYLQTLVPGGVYDISDPAVLTELASMLEPVTPVAAESAFDERDFADFALDAVAVHEFKGDAMQPFMISCQQREVERQKTLVGLNALGFTGWLEHPDAKDAPDGTPVLVLDACNPPSAQNNRRQALLGLELAARQGVAALLFEDDIEASEDLLTWLELARYLDSVMSFCAWNASNHPPEVAAAAGRAERLSTQVVDAVQLERFWGTQCVYIPARLVPKLLEADKPGDTDSFDRFLGKTCQALGEPIKLAIPNPVQHRQVPALVDTTRSPQPSLTFGLGKGDVNDLARVPVKVRMLEQVSIPTGAYQMTLAADTVQTLPYSVAKRLDEEGKAAARVQTIEPITFKAPESKVEPETEHPSEPDVDETPPTPEDKPLPTFIDSDEAELTLESPETNFDNVPHREFLERAGIMTLAEIPRDKAALVAIKGIGEGRADDILAFLADG